MARAVLSVDFEYFEHLPAYRNARGTTTDETAVGHEALDPLLSALDAHDAAATFFTVSEILDWTPGVIERVADAGHEIASHTHTHQHLSEITAEQRREQLSTSKARLEAATGQEIRGFRAPSFDMADDHFAMLADLGYEYDSSVVACRSIPGWYGGEFDLQEPAPATAVDRTAPGDLAEVPVAVMPWLALPLTGTWIRFFGVNYTILGMRWLARRGIPPVLYVHPWELVDLPEVEGLPSRVRVRTGAYMRRAVEKILAQPFEFVTCGELATDALAEGRP